MDHARSTDPAVQAQLDRFAKRSPGRDVLGLERIEALLDRLGNPHRVLPPVFHIAGTNGKGSTCAFLRSILEAAGHTVHVYTSPHLVRFNERIRIAGRLIDDDALAPLLTKVIDAAEAEDIGASFFEITTAAALLAFARTPADACVIEVGLGGRLDATNVVHPLVCGIAQIGLDHQAFLGDTLEAIATEKAGIAKPSVPLLVLDQGRDSVDRTLAKVAEARGAPIFPAFSRWQFAVSEGQLQYRGFGGDVMTPLPALAGAHQLRNAALAIAMLKHQKALRIPPAAYKRGVAEAAWPARLQRLGPGPLAGQREVWIDGAHNPEAADALAAELARRPPCHLVLGILANKDAARIIAPLAPLAASLTFVPVPGHDHHSPKKLARDWGGRAATDLSSAVTSTPTLIAGSLYLCGEALRLNEEAPD